MTFQDKGLGMAWHGRPLHDKQLSSLVYLQKPIPLGALALANLLLGGWGQKMGYHQSLPMCLGHDLGLMCKVWPHGHFFATGGLLLLGAKKMVHGHSLPE